MKNNLIFSIIIIVVSIAGICIYIFICKDSLKINSNKIKENAMNEKLLAGHKGKQASYGVGKKAAMIVAFEDFRDEEYFIPKNILEEAGVEVKTASNKMGLAIGADGGETQVDFLLENLNPVDFDAVIFVGGAGCLFNLDNENSYKVIRETVSQNRILASICISPVILAKAGVLAGKKATVWNSALDKSPIKILEESGAIYEAKSVVQDGKIITANGPTAAQEFGQTILEALAQ